MAQMANANGGPLLPTGVRAVVHHRYVSGSWSVGDLLLDPWWELVARSLPPWLAPNLITALGTVALLTTVGAAAAESRGLLSFSALQIYCAAAIFVYQTADAVDGKQARRTGTSSPLGALFDHGCDALVSNVLFANWLVAIGLHPTLGLGCAVFISGITLFYLAQWEESATHVLRTNVGGMGVTEGQLFSAALHVASACLPRSVFSAPLLRVPAGLAELLHAPSHLSVAEGLGCALLATFALSSLLYYANVVGTARQPRHAAVLLTPAALLAAALASGLGGWLPGRAPDAPAALLFAYSLAQTHLSTQAIVLSMARQPVPTIAREPAVLALIAFAAAGRAVPLVAYIPLLWALVGVTAAVYLSFCVRACLQLKDALGVDLFLIPHTAAA
jgi:phosphatidylglycerophosphate synthase